MPQDAGENSLWAASSIANPVNEQLREAMQSDVLVIGGGYTGLSCALHLAEKGASVVLLEAKSIGFGGSGRNAGLVNAGVWQNPDHVCAQLGEEAGQRFNMALRDSPALVAELVDRYHMDCDLQPSGTVNIAHSAGGMRHLENRCRQLQELGSAVELIDGETTRATINPLSYARALAKAAQGLGARLYQESGVESLTRKNDRWLATTVHGSVSAEQVVVATNAYADRHSHQVRTSTLPVFIFQCATAPLADDIAAGIIPGREGLWDTQLLLTSSRIDKDGRLVMSSAGRLRGFQRAIRENWMTRTRDLLYPQARGANWAFSWSGQIGVTSNKILRVQLLAPGVFAPAGYNGRGIGPGSVIGKRLAETIVSGNRDDFPFPIEARYHEKWRAFRAGYYSYGTLALQFLQRR
jgi:glycine/D-amino acid oxidase-like deaminating enzyme